MNTTTRLPDFTFNVSDDYSTAFNCSLYTNRTDTGTGTPVLQSYNSSVLNDTSTTLSATIPLANGYYDWWINCTNAYGRENQSEIRNISIQVSTLECSSCSECSDIIQNQAQSGDTVKLTANITNHDGTCIGFNGKDNVIFDCNGHIISGDGDDSGYGIYLSSGSNNNVIRDCINISYFGTGINLYSSSNNVFQNITISYNSLYGINIYSGSDNIFTNIISYLKGEIVGINIYLSDYNNLTDISINNEDHGLIGIQLYLSGNNSLHNISINKSVRGGLYAYGDSSHRNNIDTSNRINGKPLQYFDGYYKLCPDNSTLNYNDTYSQVTFVGCNNIVLHNTTVIDSVYLFYTNNSEIFDVNSSYGYDGIYFWGSNNNTVTNTTSSSNYDEGIYLFDSDRNSFTYIITDNNSYGVTLSSSSDNNFTNITSRYNDYGLLFDEDGDNNTVTGSRIEDNSIAGIYLHSDPPKFPEYNLIYNNILNNSLNLKIDDNITNPNYLNTSLDCSTGNIIGGNCIGGNYWTNPGGTGFSDKCVDDSVPYGVCDSYYNLSNGTSVAIDYYPLKTIEATGSEENIPRHAGSNEYTATLMYAAAFWKEIKPDNVTIMNINKEDIGIKEIEILVANITKSVYINVIKLESRPVGVAHEAPGRIYQYIHIIHKNIEHSMKEAVITFSVNKSWIESNNIDKDTVTLNRYTDKWDRLPTTLMYEDSVSVYYRAKTPGFSYFAITGEQVSEVAEIKSNITNICNNNGVCETGESAENCSDCMQQSEVVCTPGQRRCLGKELQECDWEGSGWYRIKTCLYGCSEGRCREKQGVPADYRLLIIIGIVSAMIACVYFARRYLIKIQKKSRRGL